MNHLINLYQDSFKPVRDWCTATTVLLTPVVLVIGLAVLSWQQNGVLEQSREALRQIKAEQDAVEAEVKVLRDKVAQMALDPFLQQKAYSLQESVAARKLALEYLTGREHGNRKGFSRYFRQVAEEKYAELWLRSMEVREGGRELVFMGRTLHPKGVPPFLEELGKKEVFRNRPFQYIRIEQIPGEKDGGQPISRFAVSTNPNFMEMAWAKDIKGDEKIKATLREVVDSRERVKKATSRE